MSLRRGLYGLLARTAAELFPGYFAVVMATGELSIANQLLGYSVLAEALLAITVVAYLVLASLVILRLTLFLPRVIRDFMDHARGPGFFTLVAGTGVLGAQLVIVAGSVMAARLLWMLSLGLWIGVMYGFFFAVTIPEDKPSLPAGINGAWLIACVATQSISVLATLVAPSFADNAAVVLFVGLAAYLLGAMLYLTIITMIFYRLTFFTLTAEEMTPPYWINMGAVAISTLAGATLLMHVNEWPFLDEVKPFVEGFTLFFWVTATWWIPLLVLLMAWRHLWKLHPIRYDPHYWGMAFPLAMYTTATYQLARAEHFDFLLILPKGFVFVALAVWILAFIGLLRSIIVALRSALTTHSESGHVIAD